MKKLALLIILLFGKEIFAQMNTVIPLTGKVCNETILKFDDVKTKIESYASTDFKSNLEQHIKFICLLKIYFDKKGFDETNNFLATLTNIPNINKDGTADKKHSLISSCVDFASMFEEIDYNIGEIDTITGNEDVYIITLTNTSGDFSNMDKNEYASLKTAFVNKAEEFYTEAKNNLITEIGDIATYVKDGGTLDLDNLKVDPTLTTIQQITDKVTAESSISNLDILKKVAAFYLLNHDITTKLVDKAKFQTNPDFLGKIPTADKDKIVRLLDVLTALNLKLNGLAIDPAAIRTHDEDVLNKAELFIPVTPPVTGTGSKVEDLAEMVTEDGSSKLTNDLTLAKDIENKPIKDIIDPLKKEAPIKDNKLLQDVADFYANAGNRDSDTGLIDKSKFEKDFEGLILKADLTKVLNLLNMLTAVNQKLAGQSIAVDTINTANKEVLADSKLVKPEPPKPEEIVRHTVTRTPYFENIYGSWTDRVRRSRTGRDKSYFTQYPRWDFTSWYGRRGINSMQAYRPKKAKTFKQGVNFTSPKANFLNGDLQANSNFLNWTHNSRI